MNLNYIFIILFIIYFIYFKYNIYIRTQLLNFFVVKRGIITLNCKWYKLSDIFLKDGSGIKLYNDIKKKYNQDFYQTSMFGHKIHLLINSDYIKYIMDNSPYKFSAGILKKNFFNSFMKNNVGISCGCPWKNRRQAVENTLPQSESFFNHDIDTKIKDLLLNWKNKNKIKFSDFKDISKKITGYVIFGEYELNDIYLKYLKIVNNTSVLWSFDIKKNFKLKDKFYNLLNQSLINPKKGSLVFDLLKNKNLNKNEIIDQIPHFIFPIFSLFINTVPRILLLISNHTQVYQKLINLIKLNQEDEYVRKIILEMVRLNNPVNTTFRTVNNNTNFKNYKIKKGEQILILNNAILREPQIFKKPNLFIPERWNSKLEQSYKSISFNQGPQSCPGKELSIFLISRFIINLFKIKNLNTSSKIISKKINTKNISQSINPCNLEFIF
jgi:hypothetical protein